MVDFMTRMDEVRRNGMANAFDAGVQKGADLILCALALEFGFGPERMRRLAAKVAELDNAHRAAWNGSDEADFHKERIDSVLRIACGDAFVPFDLRNEFILPTHYDKPARPRKRRR